MAAFIFNSTSELSDCVIPKSLIQDIMFYKLISKQHSNLYTFTS